MSGLTDYNSCKQKVGQKNALLCLKQLSGVEYGARGINLNNLSKVYPSQSLD